MAPRRSDDDDAPRTPPQRTPLQQKILDALPARVDMPDPSFGYRLAGWWIAGVSLLLPLVYFAFVALVAHAVWWHWQNNMGWMRAGVWAFLFFIGVLGSGVLTLLFLIKPLFSWGGDKSKPQIIRRSVEPFLYDYVEALCDALDAPRPKSIQVDLSPNAAAGYRHGFWSLFTGNLTLIVGLPLVSGMSVRQLSGILAHEFGHFSQGFGMRATYVSGLILQRLARAAYERDWFDAKLDEFVVPGKAGVVFYPVKWFVWLAREFVGRLFSFGLAIRSRMSREMEFDADGYEAMLIGSTTFARSCSALKDLNLAHSMAMNDIESFYEEGRLADNFPALIVSNVPRIKPEFRKAMRKLERERKAHKFDTHPPDRERILKAREKGPDGLLTMPGEKPDYPAVVLFANFNTLCKAATTECYRDLLGPKFRKNLIHPVEKMIERREQEHAAGEALDRYFLCHVPVDRPLTLTDDAAKPPTDAKAEFETLKESRLTMLKHLVAYRNYSDRYDVAIDTVFTTAEALSIIDCGLAVKAEDFNLVDRRPSTVEEKHERARGAVQHLAQEMLPFEEAATNRLQAALRLLQNPKVSERIPDGAKLAEELRELVPQAVHIGSVVSGLPSLRVLWRRINVLYIRYAQDTNQHNLGSSPKRVGELSPKK